jgi:hypothetical protein
MVLVSISSKLEVGEKAYAANGVFSLELIKAGG